MLNFVWFSVLERKCWCSDIFAKPCLLLRTASHVSDAPHLPLVQYFISFHLAQEKMKELTGPGKWEQWTHWKTKTQDHRNRGAAKGELEKILSAEPVSSQKFRQNSVSYNHKFLEFQTKFCLLNQQVPRGSDKFLSPTTVNFQRFRQNSVC